MRVSDPIETEDATGHTSPQTLAAHDTHLNKDIEASEESKTAVALPSNQPRTLAPWLAYSLFILCTLSFLIPLSRTLFIRSDEGVFLSGAARIIHGQIFARDFFEIMGPGSFYWMAAFFKIFGTTFLAARIGIFLPLLGTSVTLYALARQVCTRYRAIPCLLLAGPYFGLIGQVEGHHVDSNFFALLAIALLAFWNHQRRNGLLVAVGALSATTAWTLQPKGVLLFGAILVWFLLQRKRLGTPFRFMALTATGFFGVVGLVLAYFWSAGALNSLIYANYIFPSQTYGKSNAVPYAQGLHEIWSFFVTQPEGLHWPAVVAAVMILPSVFIATLPILVLALGVFYKWPKVRPEIVLYWLCGWAIWISEFHRRDLHHLAYGSPLLIVLCVHMLAEYRIRLLQTAVWATAFCAASLAAFNALVAAEIPKTMTRAGLVAVFGDGSVPVLNYLNEHLQPAEDIFVYPCSSVYYFLSASTNPTPYSCFFYGQNTPEQFHNAIRILERRQVKYVIWDTVLLSSLAKNGLMPGSLPSNPDEMIFEPYLLSHFTPVMNENGILILERKEK